MIQEVPAKAWIQKQKQLPWNSLNFNPLLLGQQ
jgi:hypothetical protein